MLCAFSVSVYTCVWCVCTRVFCSVVYVCSRHSAREGGVVRREERITFAAVLVFRVWIARVFVFKHGYSVCNRVYFLGAGMSLVFSAKGLCQPIHVFNNTEEKKSWVIFAYT